MNQISFRKSPLALALGLAIASQSAYSQKLEEVVVTAQKRVESLQDVPISVSAMQGEQIQEAGIPNMAALADYVPNLHIANASVNTNIYMRGVGSGNNQGFEQSVGMYIDGVYMGRGRQYRNAFMDLARVEVLRGPQGTLFGRNTVAGAVNILTASSNPGDEFNGEVAVSGESNSGLIVEGFVGGSLTDTLGARFAFKYRETDGFIDNDYIDEDEPNLEESTYRVSLVWEPMDELTATFKYSHSDEERTGAQSSTWLYLDQADRDALVPNRSAFASAAYALMDTNFPGFGAQADEEFTTFRDNSEGDPSSPELFGRFEDGDDADVDNYMLQLDYDWNEYTLTAVTGYSEYDFQAGADVDWLPLRFIHRDDDQDYEQFSQEFRITSPGGEFFDWLGGVYYDESELNIDRRVGIDGSFDDLFGDLPSSALDPTLPDISLRDLLGVTSLYAVVSEPLLAYDAQIAARNHKYSLDSDSWAVFFQGTFNFTDYLRVTVGARYTEESKDVDSAQFISDDLTGLGTPSNNYQLGLIQANQFNTYVYDYSDDRETDDFLPSINVQWDVGIDHMLYASFSQGFKSGGFTAADDGEPGQVDFRDFPCTQNPDGTYTVSDCYDPTVANDDFEFDDESVDAYEIGGKHTLFDESVTLNWAAFYTEYDDLQTAIFKGIGFTVTNASSSEIKGIEIDGRWAATENLQIAANFAYLDASYDDFGDAPCTAIQLDATNQGCGQPDPARNPTQAFNDLSGERTLYASDYSASILFDYVRPIKDMDLFVSGEVNYRDEFDSAGDNDPIDVIDSYTKTNLRIGLRAESWEVMAYGRNIFDEDALQQSFDTPVLAGSHSRFMDEGRVVGLRAKYVF